MDTFYDKEGKVLGKAWSAALDECYKTDAGEEHEPHPWNPKYACYGPYMCSGFPKVQLFNTKPRKPVN